MIARVTTMSHRCAIVSKPAAPSDHTVRFGGGAPWSTLSNLRGFPVEDFSHILLKIQDDV